MDLQGKVAVVTGVSKGIGRALVEQLLEKGCMVVGLGRTAPDLDHNNFEFHKTDVRDYDQVNSAITHAVLKFGSDIHILINNAGLGYFGYLENHTLEQWDAMYQTNVNGIFYTCKEVIPLMKKTGFGHIINIASTAGLEGYPQVSGYCGTKHAVRGISDSLYKELREFKIKVTCVYPGSTKTDFFRNSPSIEPHDYMLQPEDVAMMMVHALETPDNFHQVNLEVRPLQPKGPKK
jgi:NADP-dependent 3-hydroxy acid dehydrogenase YdfG